MNQFTTTWQPLPADAKFGICSNCGHKMHDTRGWWKTHLTLNRPTTHYLCPNCAHLCIICGQPVMPTPNHHLPVVHLECLPRFHAHSTERNRHASLRRLQ